MKYELEDDYHSTLTQTQTGPTHFILNCKINQIYLSEDSVMSQ